MGWCEAETGLKKGPFHKESLFIWREELHLLIGLDSGRKTKYALPQGPSLDLVGAGGVCLRRTIKDCLDRLL